MKAQKILSALLPGAGLALDLCLTAAGANENGVTVMVDGAPLAVEAYINESGTTMVPLRALAEALGCTVAWDEGSRTVTVTSKEEEAAEETPAPPVVMLDPGHGGESTGASYSGVAEKDLNLAIAQKAAAFLAEAGVDVRMTRTDDRDVGLYERTDLAAQAEAALFVSVHCNASLTHSDAMGVYTAAYEEGGESWRMAEALRTSVTAAAGAGDMGTEARPDLAVLRTASMPAVLVECGYMSTPEELSLLAWPEYQTRLARGIADGILACLEGAGQ